MVILVQQLGLLLQELLLITPVVGGAHNNMQPTEFIGNVFIFAKYTDYI
jgi:hypothetical protein